MNGHGATINGLRLAAADLATLGALWMGGGRWHGRRIMAQFDPGPPPTDQLQPGWRPARNLVVDRLVPALLQHAG